jgi:hypothetical protein
MESVTTIIVTIATFLPSIHVRSHGNARWQSSSVTCAGDAGWQCSHILKYIIKLKKTVFPTML